MAGLLDFLGSDDARLGMGLLAAGGPSTVPMNVGQRVQMAMQGMDADKQNKLRQALLQSQVDENVSQRALQQQKLALAQRQQAWDEQFMGGGSPGAGAMPSAAPVGLPPQGAAPAGLGGAAPAGGFNAQAISQRYGVPYEAVVSDFRFNGGKKIAELIAERSKPNWMNVGGNLVNTNAAGFQGGIQDQVNISNDGRATVLRANGGNPVVGAPEGALATYGAYQGIANRSNADFTPQEVIGPDGRRVVMPRSAVLQPQGGRLTPMAGPAGNVQSPGYSGGDRNSANAESIRIIQSEMLKPGNSPEDMAGLRREMARLQMQSGQPVTAAPAGNVVGLSPAEEAANKAAETKAVGTASAEVARETAAKAEGKRGAQMGEVAKIANQLLDADPTGSGIGAMADQVGNFIGRPLKGASQAQQLEALSGWLTANIPRMEGPQSDADVRNYATMAGKIGDRTLPAETRKAALATLIELQGKYAALNGVEAPKAAAASGAKPPTPMKGMTMDGYKFKGGNPADPANWTKL